MNLEIPRTDFYFLTDNQLNFNVNDFLFNLDLVYKVEAVVNLIFRVQLI